MDGYEAAKVIGCDSSHVRRMIRAGTMKGKLIVGNGPIRYEIARNEALRVRKIYAMRPHRLGRPPKKVENS